MASRSELHLKRVQQIEEEYRNRQLQQRLAQLAQISKQRRVEHEKKEIAEKNMKLLNEWREKKRLEDIRRRAEERRIRHVEENRKSLRQAMSELIYDEWLKKNKGKKLNIPRNGYQVFGPKPALIVQEEWIREHTEPTKDLTLSLSALSVGDHPRSDIVPDFKSLTPWKCKGSPGSSPKSHSYTSSPESVKSVSDVEVCDIVVPEPETAREPVVVMTAYQRARQAYGLSSAYPSTVGPPVMPTTLRGCTPRTLKRSVVAPNISTLRRPFKV